MKTTIIFLLASCVLLLAQTNQQKADLTSSKIPTYEATAHLMNALQFGGNLETIKSLLDQGADVNAHDNDGSHALQLAAKRGDLEIIRLLLVNGADVNATNSFGYTALDSAAYRGFLDIAKILVEKGAAVDEKGSDGGTALMSAAWSGQTNAIIFLLDKGANINATNWSGDTALQNAVDKNNTEVVKILLARGANVNVENFLNQTALDDARRNNNSVIVQLLQQAGATKSSSTRLDEAMSDSLEKYKKSTVVLSNALSNFLQPDSVPSPVTEAPVSMTAPEMSVNPVAASGTNTDSSGYVTNTDLLIPFTLTNSAGDVITNAVLVKLTANKFIYKAPGGGGMMSLTSLPRDLQEKFGYEPQAANSVDEADQQKKARQQQFYQQQLEAAAQQSSVQAQRKTAVSDVSLSIRANAEKKWPGDFDMQKYEVDKQTEAYNWVVTTSSVTGIPQGVFEQIKAGALDKWPDDYDMQKNEIEKQVKAYTDLH